MSFFYNDIDPRACAWLRNLMYAGLIPEGVINAHSISTLDLGEMHTAHFFAGVGGWPLALRLAGWRDEWPVWTGSCPCQPFSQAGKRKGKKDPRHLWPEFRTIIAQFHPPILFGEQVASADGRIWLSGVRADLETLGYEVGAADLCAAGIGAPHIRQRLFWVAHRGHLQSRGGYSVAGEMETRERREPGIHAAAGGILRGLSDAHAAEARGGIAGVEGSPRIGRYRPSIDGAVDGLEQSDSIGSQAGIPGQEQGKKRQSNLSLDTSGNGWSNFVIIPCADGKFRRLEPGLAPLVNGFPRKTRPLVAQLQKLGVTPFTARRIVREAKASRGIRLKGYGNAIVPALAAEFIQAFMESVGLEAA